MPMVEERPVGEDIAQLVREHAFRSIHSPDVATTNLSMDRAIRQEGEVLGPSFQGIKLSRASIVVFVDHAPLANFGHDCHYFLYAAETGDHYASVPARFPPWGVRDAETLDHFHSPVQPVSPDALFRIRPFLPCPILVPEGNRYAIFYSGMSNTRHLNDMEFGYRTLIHRYGFVPGNITVLSYDGTTNTQDGANTTWPGDGSPYQIHINGEGDQAAFESAIDALKPKLGPNDLLFIHTNNHGDWNGSQSFLCAYPSWGSYLSSDFCSKLAELPEFRALIVMMEQCNSGGFITPILSSSTAKSTSVACAATQAVSSWATPDGHWDTFAYNWFAAQSGAYPNGAALAFNPDTNHDGKIEATEAYGYAKTVDTQDTPQYGDVSGGGQTALGQEYTIWWWWCELLREVLEPLYDALPLSEYLEHLNGLEPSLRELAKRIDGQSEALREDVAAQLKELVTR